MLLNVIPATTSVSPDILQLSVQSGIPSITGKMASYTTTTITTAKHEIQSAIGSQFT